MRATQQNIEMLPLERLRVRVGRRRFVRILGRRSAGVSRILETSNFALEQSTIHRGEDVVIYRILR